MLPSQESHLSRRVSTIPLRMSTIIESDANAEKRTSIELLRLAFLRGTRTSPCLRKAPAFRDSTAIILQGISSLINCRRALVSMMQAKLGQLVGKSSGYVESLPAQVRRRVDGLKGIQKDHAKLEAEFQEEVLQLEKKYFAKFTPLYEKRAKIVNGDAEPTDAEIEAGKPEEDRDQAEDEAEEKAETSADDTKGIPEFWLSAMKNQISLAELITTRDEEVLRSLTDIRMEYLDRPGFRLIFEFAPNDFFTNKTISKTYFYREESGYGGDFIYDHAEGDKIDWKAGKDLTVRVESKKQRNKSMLAIWC